ncbi:MAG: hypothetical protein AAFN94_13100, partial [Pseudomonadota bacterium]
LLSRRPARATPCLDILPDAARAGTGLGLALGRMHELCGPSRHRMALWLAAQTRGHVMWIVPEWSNEHLSPCGAAPYVDPARMIMVHPGREDDALWCAEETLRAGSVALVVIDLPGLPGLTPVRRMHLAAEAGGQKGGALPLGVLLTPGMGGAQGVESRWHLAPDYKGQPGAWRLSRLRARMAPEQSWQVTRTPGQSLPQISHRLEAA